jgi:hypothetical protein
MWVRRVVVAVAIGLLVGAASRLSAFASATDPALTARLQRIESAFRSGNAGALRASFSGGKVRVDLKGLTDGPGAYGAGQLEVIFERIFDENRTREFSIRNEDVTVSGPGTAFARGRWSRRLRPAGADATDTLTFTLREEAGDWRVHEIRSSR